MQNLNMKRLEVLVDELYHGKPSDIDELRALCEEKADERNGDPMGDIWSDVAGVLANRIIF